MNTGFLTDRQFKERNADGASIVSPFDEGAIQAASIDLRLGNMEVIYEGGSYTLGQDIDPEEGVVRQTFTSKDLSHGATAFIVLKEEISIPSDCMGVIFPRSSITRLGVVIPPVYMNPGYRGHMLLTISNLSGRNIKILPDMRVAQLVCAKLAVLPEKDYRARAGKYSDEKGAPSRMADDVEIREAVQRILESALPETLR